MNYDILKYIFFNIHKIGIILTNIGWLYSPYVLLLHIMVIISWKLNSNRCLISQLEYYLFNSTFMGNNFYVPRKQRIFLYCNFLLGCIYNYFLTYFFFC
jgi:hypothetical protein